MNRSIKKKKGSSSLLLLIQPHEFRLRDDMSLHLLLEDCLGGMFQIRKHDIQRVEFMKVSMLADRGAGSPIPCALPVIEPAERSNGKIGFRHSLRQTLSRGRN